MHWIRYHIGVAYMLSPWYHIISCVHIVIKTLYNSKIALKGRIAIKIRKFNNMQFHFSWKFTRCHGVLTKTWGGRGGGCSTELGRCAATFQRSFRWQLATFSKCFWRARGFQFAFSKRTMRRWLQTHDDPSYLSAATSIIMTIIKRTENLGCIAEACCKTDAKETIEAW